MKRNAILDTICLLISNGKELTQENLNSYGINNEMINKLILSGTLIANKENYTFTLTNYLFEYAKNLIHKQKRIEANRCFLKCYEVDPHNLNVCMELYVSSLRNGDYASALNYFDTLYQNSWPEIKNDLNFQLFLLSFITNVPAKYHKILNNLKREDILFNKNESKEIIELENEIRKNAFARKFRLSAKQLTRMLNKKYDGKYKYFDHFVIRILINEAITAQSIAYEKEIELLRNKDYQTLIKFLKNLSNKRKFNKGEYYLYKLTKELINIKDTKNYFKPTIYKTNNVFDAIDAHNYELALKLTLEKNEMGSNIFSIILNDICDEITKLNIPNEKNKSSKTIKNFLDHFKTGNDSLYDSIILEPLTKEEENALISALEKYPNIFAFPINIPEYRLVLKYTVNNTNLNENMREAYIAFNEYKYDKCLEKTKEAISNCNNVRNLAGLYELLAVTYLGLGNDNISDYYLTIAEGIKNNLSVIVQDKKIENQDPLDQIPQEEINKIKKILDGFLETEDNTILLPNINKDIIDNILQKDKRYSNLKTYYIGLNSNKILLKKYCVKDSLKLGQLKRDAFKYFQISDYDSCILQVKELLPYLDDLREICKFYRLLENSYLRKKDLTKALKYLIIEKEIKDELQIKTTNIANKIKQIIKDMNNNYYFELENIEKIASLITGTDINVQEICQILKYNKKQETLINLILARDCYINEKYELGDTYLNDALLNENMDVETIRLTSEIQRNKLLYKNMKNFGYKPLILQSENN